MNAMISFTSLCRFTGYVVGSYRNAFHGRSTWFPSGQICNYTRKSAEDKLGIEKPKRPLTPFFKFMSQMRPALLAKNPGISSKEAILWSSKHWQQLDTETKEKLVKEYEKDLEDYKKIKTLYEESLTEGQRADIMRVKEEMAAAKEKRKLKAEYKELGRPKKPMSSYFLFGQTKKNSFKGKNLKEYQEQLKIDWANLPDNDKKKFEKQAQTLMEKYKKDLQVWEVKMVSIGRSDLVKSHPVREKKTKTAKSNK